MIRENTPIDISSLPPELAAHPAIEWAAGEFDRVLRDSGQRVDGCVRLLAASGAPEESFRVEPGRPVRVIAGDVRGFVYALGELAEQLRPAPGAVFQAHARSGRPATPVRGMMRLLTSEVEDERWFRDRSFWSDYLDELARARVNRFTLGTGAGYDYFIDRDYRDLYFQFAYPFFVAPEGWQVGAVGISDEQRADNLDLLRHIAQETRRRGISFRLGLWNHAWDCAPLDGDARYRIVGLDAETHAPYCRDALWTLLTECPDIEGVTFRVHFEGGVPEPAHEFWRVVVSRLASVDSLREIDVHAKGVDERLREVFGAAGKRLSLSTKFWAEHTGPSYHQASIRERERDPGGRRASALRAGGAIDDSGAEGRRAVTGTTTARSFTRYGYADFLRDDRDYDVLFRIWPGSQRLLVWGDPEAAAEMGRIGIFGGARGWDWFEPLSFKGKKGSGKAGGRDLYRRQDLALGVADWRKYRYTIRLFGRLGYDPDAPAEVWRTVLREDHGDEADRVEAALRSASRILPLVTLVHAPSAAQNMYWPEMYTDVPLTPDPDPPTNPWRRSGWAADGSFDTDGPYVFQNASPLDPELIYGIAEYAEAALAGELDGRRTPAECAEELDRLAAEALAHAGERPDLEPGARPQTVRVLVDAAIAAWTGRFFAAKIRAATAFTRFGLTGHVCGAAAAVDHLRAALAAWDRLCEVAAVYDDDLTFGLTDYARGHWTDRRPAIAADLARVTAVARAAGWDPAAPPRACAAPPRACAAVSRACAAVPGVSAALLDHDPAVDATLGPGGAVIRARMPDAVTAMELRFRHVNQAEAWSGVAMTRDTDGWAATIPAGVLSSPYRVQYLFHWTAPHATGREPQSWGARPGQPYFVLRF